MRDGRRVRKGNQWVLFRSQVNETLTDAVVEAVEEVYNATDGHTSMEA